MYGFGGNLLTWLESYLHNRFQRVTILGATSSPLPVTSGVPQGSILGPMLFLLYVNSLPNAVRSSKIAAFADDTKIFKEITSTCDAEQLQEDLSNLVTWSDSASLNFNFSKCKAQRITRKLKPVTFACRLKFSVPRKILVFTSRLTPRGISRSMRNALRPAGSWDIYGETLDSSKVLRLDVQHTLP